MELGDYFRWGIAAIARASRRGRPMVRRVGDSRGAVDHVSTVEGYRRALRRSETAPISLVARATLAALELLALVLFLRSTRPGILLSASFAESIVAQVALLIVLPFGSGFLIWKAGDGIARWIERTRSLSCPHCAASVPVHLPWKCPYCRGENLSTAAYAFVNRCAWCRRQPEGFHCPRCGAAIALIHGLPGGGRDRLAAATPIGWRPDPEPVAGDARPSAPQSSLAWAGGGIATATPEDPRDALTAGFGLRREASVDEILSAFRESKDSDAKAYLAPQEKALERMERLGGAAPSALPVMPPSAEIVAGEDAEVLRGRIAAHLGAGDRASWQELEEYFAAADSDTKAAMDADDEAALRRLADAERKVHAH